MKSYPSMMPCPPSKGWKNKETGEFILTPSAYTSAECWLDHVGEKIKSLESLRVWFVDYKLQLQLIADLNNSEKWEEVN